MKKNIRKIIRFLIRSKDAFFSFLVKCFIKSPDIESIDSTLDYMVQKKCSVSRFGDGEFDMIIGYGNNFQKYDARLSQRLREIVVSDLNNHIICLPNIFGSLKPLRQDSRKFNKTFLKNRRAKIYGFLNLEKQYYNSFCTRPYYMFKDKSNSPRYFEKIKILWGGVDLLIIEGEKSRLGMGNDLFSNARSIKRILCPAENAFAKYDEILQSAKQHGDNALVLIALGMTATVLAYDLAAAGYWAIDIGHIDIEYAWFLSKQTERVIVNGKYTNEAKGGNVVDDQYVTTEYLNEILCKLI